MFKASVLLLLALVALGSAAPRVRLAKSRPTRIVGGENATPHEFPYLVSLEYFGSPLCGGAIIRADAIITVAHCAEVGPPEAFTVKAGKHNIREVEDSEQLRRVRSYVIHEGYPGTNGFSNDIAVLRTDTPFTFSSAVAPVPLAPTGHTATGIGRIAGWGSTQEDGSPSDILQKTEVPIQTDAVCRAAYGDDRVEDNMICAGVPEGGKDFCEGDSGVPLVAADRGYRYLAGLASFGFGCARPGYPSVYTEISHHTQFINDNADGV